MSENVMVSIVCTAYNHEKHIRNTLESFVNQKTNFKFEVLVHDDASTDKTAEIIKEYELKYPELIKPIYQTENQYSKKIKITLTYQIPRASGKYIAFCEGDDYWTDEYKLQKQVDAMEKHPDVDICTHAANLINTKTGEIIRKIAPEKQNTIIPAEKIISGGGGFVATASIMIRSSVWQNLPEFVKFSSYDYTYQIMGSLRGGMLYLSDNMSVYSTAVEGSWSQRMSKNSSKFIAHKTKTIQTLNILDKETDFKFSKAIKRKCFEIKLEILECKIASDDSVKFSEYIDMIKAPVKWKVKYAWRFLPGVKFLYKKIKLRK